WFLRAKRRASLHGNIPLRASTQRCRGTDELSAIGQASFHPEWPESRARTAVQSKPAYSFVDGLSLNINAKNKATSAANPAGMYQIIRQSFAPFTVKASTT